MDNLDEAKQAWIEDALESGDVVPEPAREEELPSGKWLQRVPRSLHKKLPDLAKKEQVEPEPIGYDDVSRGCRTTSAACPDV